MGRERQLLAGTHVAPLVTQLVELHHRPDVRTADRRPADLGRRGDVAGHEPRGNREYLGVVVEPETGHVGRQQLITGHLEPQQVLDDADVLEPVQSARGDPAGVRLDSYRTVERRFDRREEAVDVGLSGARPPLGRHLPLAQLTHDALEHLGVGRRVGDIHLIEQQPAVRNRSLWQVTQ